MMKNTLFKDKEECISYIFLILGMSIAFLIISISITYVKNISDRNKTINEVVNMKARSLEIKENNNATLLNTKEIKDVFKKTDNKMDIMITSSMMSFDKDEANTYRDVKVEWFNNDNIKHFPLIKGKYYTSSQISRREKVVVIGQSLVPLIEKKNGKEYIYIKNNAYQVVGILGIKDVESYIDEMVCMPITSIPKAYKKDIETINFSCEMYCSSDDVEKNIKSLEEEFKKMDCNVSIIDHGFLNNDEGISDVDGEQLLNMSLLGYVVSIVYAINIVSFWIEKRKYEMAVRKAVGYSNYDIGKIIYKEMAIVMLISCICGLLIQTVLKIFVNKILEYDMSISLTNVFISIIVVFLTALFTTIWPIIKIMKIEVIKSLKS